MSARPRLARSNAFAQCIRAGLSREVLALSMVFLLMIFAAACTTSDEGDGGGNNGGNPPPPPANRAPTANPGGNLSAHINELVALNGTASSDPDGDTLTYEWSLMSGPAGGGSLSDVSVATAHFQAAMPGSYVVQLVVHDPANASGSGSVTIDITNPPPPANVRVTIDHPSVWLTSTGQTQQLRAFDSQGAPVTTGITWTSSAPDQVSVDASGQIAGTTIGSAMIFAEVNGVKSLPTFVIVAEPKAGALLVTDSQIVAVGGPIGLAPGALPGVGTQYEVTLSGVNAPPVPGTVVVGTGDRPLAGKVVSTRADGSNLVALLAVAPLYEILARYHIAWDIELKDFPLEPEPIEATAESVQAKQGSGAAPIRTADESPVQPFQAFKCDGEAKASLATSEVNLSPNIGLKLIVEGDSDSGAVKRALTGTETLEGKVGIKFKPEITASGTCLAQANINIPVLGLVSALIMPAVRLGIGVELSGTLHIADGEISATGKVGSSQTVGWACDGETATCHSLDDIHEINEFKFEIKSPSINQMHVDASGHFFVLLGLDAVFLTQLHAEMIEARIGPKQAIDLGLEDDQAKNKSYASNYDLKIAGTVEPGSALKAAIKELINDDGVGVTFRGTFEHAISESPKGTLQASKDKVRRGDSVDFTVNLTGSTVDYAVYGYNVESIQLWRKGEQDFEFEPFHTISVTASNQSTFQYRWEPQAGDVGKYEFAAFVVTQLPVSPILEIADDSIKEVEVSCFGLGGQAAKGARQGQAVTPQALTCADTWVGTAEHLIPHGESMTATITWTKDPELSTGDSVFYLASGSFEWHHLVFEEAGCTVSPTHFTIDTSGGVTSSNILNVDYNFDPPKFSGNGQQATELTISCPGDDPFTVPASLNWFNGLGEVSADGLTIQGSTVTPQGSSSFHFTRP